MSAPGSFLDSRDGVRIHYRVQGEGPTLILIHGVGANLQSWDAIADRVQARFRVVRADLRGHGQSGRITGAGMADFVADLFALADAVGATDFALAGFSLGGLIAQYCALEAPQCVRRLVLISAVAQRTADERKRLVERAELLERDGIMAVTGAASERWFTPAFKARYPERVAQRLAELAANDLASYVAAYRVFGLADEGVALSRIAAPTLVMTGEDDPGSNPRMAKVMHEAIAGSELEIFPGLRHSLLLEAPDLISDRLERFLADDPRGAARA